MYIRVSYGTLSILGLQYYPSNVKPNIAYIMQYDPQGCLGKCSFCSQSRYYKANKEFLSRIVWPKMDLNT
ncbi:MAG TPA: biotin synthase, partial [Acidilobales archaeon]|nr:biotin synthase [Acidilobales archaeon]